MTDHSLLDARAYVGVVSLTVAYLERSSRFYRDVLGLAPAERSNGSALLAAGDTPLLHLVELTGAQPKPARATGLYHFAVLLPGRIDLARWLRHFTVVVPDATALAALVARVQEAGIAVTWQADGWYLNDPSGNGIRLEL